MKNLLICLSILFIGIVFCITPCYAACSLSSDNGSYTTVIRYVTGRAKVQEKWECAQNAYAQGNGVCFYNILDNEGNSQYICLSGEFKVVFPMNEY
jgi:hypothetical protein